MNIMTSRAKGMVRSKSAMTNRMWSHRVTPCEDYGKFMPARVVGTSTYLLVTVSSDIEETSKLLTGGGFVTDCN